MSRNLISENHQTADLLFKPIADAGVIEQQPLWKFSIFLGLNFNME